MRSRDLLPYLETLYSSAVDKGVSPYQAIYIVL